MSVSSYQIIVVVVFFFFSLIRNSVTQTLNQKGDGFSPLNEVLQLLSPISDPRTSLQSNLHMDQNHWGTLIKNTTSQSSDPELSNQNLHQRWGLRSVFLNVIGNSDSAFWPHDQHMRTTAYIIPVASVSSIYFHLW